MKGLRLMMVVLLGAVLYRGVSWLSVSGPLELKDFKIEGNDGRRVSDQELIRASGVKKGTRLLKISTGEVRRSIETLPWVRKATVERVIPSRLRISVVQRTPELVVMTAQGPFLVDNRGKVLQQASEELPWVRELPVKVLTPGMRVPGPEFAQASRIVDSLPPGLRSRVLGIRAPSIDRIALEMTGGPVILYGAAEQMPQKNYAAGILLEKVAAQAMSSGVIDVTVPSRPGVRAA